MERWYWIELIGFDCDAEDFGVEAFLSRNVSTTGISLLFSHIDFLFHTDQLLLPTSCSYAAHEYNRERGRQAWTRTHLRGLVEEFHRRGVQVFFSCFDMTTEITDPAWLSYGRQGRPTRSVYVIKDGVGKAVVERIAAVIEEFGFDGFQLADGLSSNRRSIENGDFSVALCEASGISVPHRLMGEGEDAYAARRSWILRHARFEWIEFLAGRWEAFYALLFDTVNKPIVFNSAWTRDPFEALYRYGLDYTRCRPEQAMAVMVEENSAARAIMSPEDEGGVEHTLEERDRFPYEYALMQQGIRLATNGLRQLSLMPISDTQEQWDALRHCPTELTRSIVKRYHNFVYRNGRFEICCDAPWYCLSDGIPATDWQWLARQEAYRAPTPEFVNGFVAVYHRGALRADVKQFCEKRGYYGFALLCELVCGGLNLSASVELGEVEDFDRAKCLVVTDLNCYTDEDRAALCRARLPILAIGEDVTLPLPMVAQYRGKAVSVALYGNAPEIELSDLSALEKRIAAHRVKCGEIWTEPLSHPRVSSKFFRTLCGCLNESLGLDRCSDPRIKVNSFTAGGERYLLLSSDHHTYCIPRVITADALVQAEAIMKERGYRVQCEENAISVRIPPRSVELVRIKPKS